jgi:hypothetical protein
MTQNDKLRAEADRRGAVFFQTASTLLKHLHPAGLLDEVIGALDPNFALLSRFETETRRNPFALLAVVGGLWFLTGQMSHSEQPSKTATRQGRRHRHLPIATPKGEENGYINNARQL